MPWWSWIVIWIALVALSLLFFFVLGVRLFRNFMATVKELSEAGDRFSSFPSAGAVPGNQAGVGEETDRPAAVFASPAQMGEDYRAAKASRQQIRRQRRVQRKKDRGQPQRLNDIEIS